MSAGQARLANGMRRWHVTVAAGLNAADLNLRKTVWTPTAGEAREKVEGVGYRVVSVLPAPPPGVGR